MEVPEEQVPVSPSVVPDFYVWSFPGAPVRIHLYLDVVERLAREVRRAYGSIPSHSVEVGGFLLGASDFYSSHVIEVKDFEPFLCEYRADHRFILSEADRSKMEKVLEELELGSHTIDSRTRAKARDYITCSKRYREYAVVGFSPR